MVEDRHMILNFVTQDRILKMRHPGRISFPWQTPGLPKKARTQKDPSPQLYLDALNVENAARQQYPNDYLIKNKVPFYNTKLYVYELQFLRYTLADVDASQIDLHTKRFWLDFDDRFKFYFTFDNIRQKRPQLISYVKGGSPYQVKLYVDFKDLEHIEWDLV